MIIAHCKIVANAAGHKRIMKLRGRDAVVQPGGCSCVRSVLYIGMGGGSEKHYIANSASVILTEASKFVIKLFCGLRIKVPNYTNMISSRIVNNAV